jgi:BioD-like phosphotransacetylase family protein
MRNEGMAKSAKYLIVGSTEAYSGKSATILGIIHQLLAKGLDIAYGKPLGTTFSVKQPQGSEEDVHFLTEVFDLPENRVRSPLLSLDEATIQKRLQGEDATDYRHSLQQYLQQPSGDLVLLEGPGTLSEGLLFDLSLLQVAKVLEAAVLVVARFNSVSLADSLLSAKQHLGKHLIGVLINDIPASEMETIDAVVRPFLEQQGIPVLGMLPRSALLRSVSVQELVNQLEAEVLCRPDRLDLMVESLTIGAMNVSSALEYFRKGNNMAVVTGGDRTEIQLAALETSTQCLILTGHLPPQPFILSRAEDLEIPVLSVDLDTLATVEIIDNAFGNVRVHEPIKVQYINKLMSQHFDIDRLLKQLSF